MISEHVYCSSSQAKKFSATTSCWVISANLLTQSLLANSYKPAWSNQSAAMHTCWRTSKVAVWECITPKTSVRDLKEGETKYTSIAITSATLPVMRGPRVRHRSNCRMVSVPCWVPSYLQSYQLFRRSAETPGKHLSKSFVDVAIGVDNGRDSIYRLVR